jgi:hypothetical protein
VWLEKVTRGFFDTYMSSRGPFWPKQIKTLFIESQHPDTDRWADCAAVTELVTAFKAAQPNLALGDAALKSGVHATEQTMATTSVLRACGLNI